ncbi:hypothetical protein BCR43DRAFT_510926 [Syncephalastrum racemosum]|uniref:Male-enhanced antigen 1 n=1 Tax=Syncephalastrum racemosum TaxID=13706 RepID=A0A1X2HWH3_SYNRA|nr:hypothetical protein BCR43DRAFT_510926 [Syncephalastrum racemosum]
MPEEDVVEDFARQLEEVCRLADSHTHRGGGMEESDNDWSDNEDEDQDMTTLGYQQLPVSDNEDSESEQSMTEEPQELVRPAPTIQLAPEDKIPDDTVDEIKSIMSKIQLPQEAIPEWAKSIPESMWLPKRTEPDSQEEGESSGHEKEG